MEPENPSEGTSEVVVVDRGNRVLAERRSQREYTAAVSNDLHELG